MERIASFFRNKVLLVTGSTGFLGKALVERILRQIPQVGRLILLVRPQSDSDSERSAILRAEREIFNTSIFNRLRASQGARFDALVRDKVEVVAGDISNSDLALSEELAQRLASEVDIIINSAALVAFDERFDAAVRCNTLGPLHLLNFAKRCRKAIFLHVSTAYVCGNRNGTVPEVLLEHGQGPAGPSGRAVAFQPECQIAEGMALGQSVDTESRSPAARHGFLVSARARLAHAHRGSNDRLEAAAERSRELWVRERLSQEGLSRARRFGWFDTYTFTKAMGEQLLCKHRNGVPMIILRPSIVESSLVQPEPGWIEGFRMSTPIVFGFGKGVVPDFPGKPDSIIDFIPVDTVISSLLASLAFSREGDAVKVFQVASGSENPLKLRDLVDYCVEYFRQTPARVYGGQPYVPQAWKFRSQIAFDAWLERRKQAVRTGMALCSHLEFVPGTARLRRKLSLEQTHLEQLQYYGRLYGDYARLSCRFATDNTRQLFQSLEPDDQREFCFDPNVIDWRHYIRDIHLPGVRRNVLKKNAVVPRLENGVLHPDTRKATERTASCP